MSDINTSFAELGLSESTLEILNNRSYFTPTPIQALVIPKLLENSTDIIAQARTGTGKTAAYALPIIEKLLGSSQKSPRALVLAPTRELAMQIANEISLFIGERPLKTVTVYGGQAIEIQLRALKGGADIVVGTPGRVIDMMERGALKLASVEFAVLDEADEMLDMGFVEDIETILASAPENKRMLMFSATVPPAARKIAETFMQDALYIQAPVSDSETASPLTEQWGYEVRREDKFAALKRILNAEGRIYAMIFCRTRTDVDELTMSLQKNKFSAEALHGELTQNQRTRVIEQFKNRRFDMLVATDVAARGIDVNDLTHVINYALPMNEDIYTHRIGRTGRAGKKGVAISLFTPSEGRKFALLRRASGNVLEQRPLPDAKAIIKAKKSRFRADLETAIPHTHAVYQQMAQELSEVFDPEVLLAALLEMRFHKDMIPENYPSLSKGKRESRFARDRERNRRGENDRRHENDRSRDSRPPRRREKQSIDQTADDNRPDTRKNDRRRKDERPGRPEKAEKNMRQDKAEKRNFPQPEKPRKKLRDWAMNLTDGTVDLPRYKVKKRK